MLCIFLEQMAYAIMRLSRSVSELRAGRGVEAREGENVDPKTNKLDLAVKVERVARGNRPKSIRMEGKKRRNGLM